MTFHVTTDRLEIKIETHEEFKHFPVSNDLLQDIDNYPPHQVEALLEGEPAIKMVSVDWYCPWETKKAV